MAHQNDRHLTTEQLSALLDKQLFPGEQLGWNAHLSVCQECQARLADLRRTVALLHALPQAELPRSFVLPATTALAPEGPAHPVRQVATVTPISRANGSPKLTDRRERHMLRRSIRVMSTLAAVVGFILIMSGILTNVHFGGGAATSAPITTSTGANIPANHNAVTPPTTARSDQPTGTHPPTKGTEKPGASTPQTAQTPSETVGSAQSSAPSQNQNLPLPAALDLSRPEGQEGIGVIVFVLGILGLIVTRMIRRRTERM